MTKEQEKWFKAGKNFAGFYPDHHPDNLIQSEWILGSQQGTPEMLGGFYEWLNLFRFWALGVRKGSLYFENN